MTYAELQQRRRFIDSCLATDTIPQANCIRALLDDADCGPTGIGCDFGSLEHCRQEAVYARALSIAEKELGL